MDHSFLDGVNAQKGRWRDSAAEAKGVSTRYYWLGSGRDALEVAYGTAGTRPNATTIREVWKQRHGRSAAPLLVVVVAYRTDLPRRALVCGPTGENPPVVDLDHTHAERLAAAALAEPDRHVAIRFLASALEGDPGEQSGLRNRGLLATHELLYGTPERPDWGEARTRSGPLLGLRGQDLVRGLGYEIEPRGQHSVLRAAEGQAQAVAVFLEEAEQPDQTSARFENQTLATYALAHAERDRLPWVVAVRGGTIRLYSTSTSGAAGQRTRTEAFVELNLPLLPSERAGYLHLLFSAAALAGPPASPFRGRNEPERNVSSNWVKSRCERFLQGATISPKRPLRQSEGTSSGRRFRVVNLRVLA